MRIWGEYLGMATHCTLRNNLEQLNPTLFSRSLTESRTDRPPQSKGPGTVWNAEPHSRGGRRPAPGWARNQLLVTRNEAGGGILKGTLERGLGMKWHKTKVNHFPIFPKASTEVQKPKESCIPWVAKVTTEPDHGISVLTALITY